MFAERDFHRVLVSEVAARAAIFEHAPEDRPEAIATRVVQLYLHGIGGPAALRRQRGAA